jgi:methionyl-tRNA formyltransferase
MRIVYMGTPDFAVPILRRLLESDHEVVCVVTQPDKPAGRGKHLASPPVKDVAIEAGIPVLQPARIRGTDFHDVLGQYCPEVIVVAAYGKILPREVLSVPRYGCINVHASLLPKYRGAAPIAWAIVNGEEITGVTIMHMDEGMDTGGIIAQRETEILEDDDALSVANMLSVLGADLLMEVLDRVEQAACIESLPQDASLATYAPILQKSEGDIDWTMSSAAIICRMHGLRPWPCAFSRIGDSTIRLLNADLLVPAEYAKFEKPEHNPGQVVGALRGRGPVVRTGDGYVVITKAQPAGRNILSGNDLVNGGQLASPMRLERGEKRMGQTEV